MIEDIKEVPQPAETAAGKPPNPPDRPDRPPDQPPDRPRRVKLRSKQAGPAGSAVDPSSGPSSGPEEVIQSGPGAGLTRSQLIEKYGLELAQQMMDAAAGRRPPYTRDLRGDLPEPEGEGDPQTYTGPHQDRGPVHLLPRPLDFMMKPDAFFKYWRMLSKDELDRVKVRPYRLWPIIDVNQLLSPEQMEKVIRKEKRPPTKTLPPGPLKEPFDPQNWRAEVYHRYGAGDYNFILTDTHPAVHRTICMTNIIGELRDMDTYPPVLDMRTLVITDPANESYVRWCHTKGVRIPGREDEDEEGEMAATKVLAEAVTQLARDSRTSQQQQPRENTAETIRAVTSMMADASRANQEQLIKSMEQQRRSEDPIEFHTRVMETAKTMVPPQNNGNMDSIVKLILDSNEKAASAMKEANNSVMQIVLQGQKSLEARLAEAEKRNAELQLKILELAVGKTNASDQSASAATGLKSPMDAFTEVSKMMTGVLGFMDKLADRAPRGGGDSGSIWSRIAEKVVDAAPNVMYNFSLAQRASAAVKSGPGANLPEPLAPGQPGEPDDGQDGGPTQEDMALQFLDSIEQPMIHALTSGASGQEFGALLTKTFGADSYEFIASQDDNTILQLLKNNQNIWSTIQRMPQRFSQFLTEFRLRDQVQQIFRQMNAMTSQPPQQQTQPPPQSQPQSQPQSRPQSQAQSAQPGVPSQVSRRLKPGQRVVHTPNGPQIVDATSTVVPDPPTPSSPPPPPPDPNPAASGDRSGETKATGSSATA